MTVNIILHYTTVLRAFAFDKSHKHVKDINTIKKTIEHNRTQKRLKAQRNLAYGIGTVLLVALVRK